MLQPSGKIADCGERNKKTCVPFLRRILSYSTSSLEKGTYFHSLFLSIDGSNQLPFCVKINSSVAWIMNKSFACFERDIILLNAPLCG